MQKIKPQPGQESVWDYPRPPRIEPFTGNIRLVFNGEEIYNHNQSFRILETSHPPTYYLPVDQFKPGVLQLSNNASTSYCEWKGRAHYYDLVSRSVRKLQAAWGYGDPRKKYTDLKDHVAIYAVLLDGAYINDEKVTPQPGGFYGGWITSNIVGPFKGGEGTWGW